MTPDSLSIPLPGFSVDFWQPYIPAAGPGDTVAATRAPGLSYTPESHGTHADFCGGDEFPRYREEVRERLAFLVAFCRRHGMPDADAIQKNFDIFFAHRFDEYHYFDTRAGIVDSVGKRSLDEFCALILNEAADLDRRKSAIRNLAQGVTLCADGAVSNLVSAACTLAKTIGGIRGKLWELKEETARGVLRELLDERFGHEENYQGNEIHFVHTVWNILADQFGLKKVPDGITMAETTGDDFLALCAAGISAALTPDRLALLIAEACQARLHSGFADARTPPAGPWTAGTEAAVAAMLEEIGDEFGLTSTDGLELGDDGETPTLRASDLRMKSFFQLDENNGAYTYALRAEPSLIALDVLRNFGDRRLLQTQTYPCNGGEWVDEAGMRAALFLYGELAWVVRIHAGASFGDPVWNSADTQIEPVTEPDLRLWHATRTSEAHPPAAAIRHAIRATAASQLARMPARWLTDAPDLQRLLRRLGTDAGRDYLAHNLAELGAVGAGYTNRERHELFAELLRLDLCHAIRPLAELWVPNESRRVNLVHDVLAREAIPAFHLAMQGEDPPAAVHAWYRPLRESGLLALVAPRLVDLLEIRCGRSPIFSHVLNAGRTAAVIAFHALVKDLLKDPTIRWHIKGPLLGLLAATDWYGIPALSNAMADGHTRAVEAYYACLEDLLTDPLLALTIRPGLLAALPDLLIGRKGNSDSGLGYALESGNTSIIGIFHTLVINLLDDPEIAPTIASALPDLLSARVCRGASALSQSMRNRGTTTIKAFYAMLKDPRIRPHIRHVMPNLLNGRDTQGKPGLSNALENGHAGIIETYHALLKDLLQDPTIAPQMLRMLPHLLTTKNKDGTSGFSYATLYGQNAAITAYNAMLDDPAIRPHIDAHLPDLRSTNMPKPPAGTGISHADGPRLSDLD